MVVLAIAGVSETQGQTARVSRGRANSHSRVDDFTSRHFLIHTDLAPQEAKALSKQLETLLMLLSEYWGRPAQGIIECYVVEDLSAWPPSLQQSFDQEGLSKIQAGAGFCSTRVLARGNRFVSRGVVYAVADAGVVRHETVHAYCIQAFGRAGAQWYAEGMAELGQNWVQDDRGVRAHPVAVQYLHDNPPTTLSELIVTDERIGGTWQDYARWWSLCHLLEYNPNYSTDFRTLGAAVLAGRGGGGFEQVFGPRADQLSFEYRFFLEHLDNGLRVDLCAWDWDREFHRISATGRTVAASIQAARGWQPSGLTVDQGVALDYAATGNWKTSKDAELVDADGRQDGPGGEGRLVGILMRDYQLGEPFPLGTSGTLDPSESGDLYVRCQDDWIGLDDNSGRISLRFSAAR